MLFCHELLSSCITVSGPLLKSARSLASAAPDHFCLICQETLFCSSGFSPVCNQLLSSCLYCLRASSLICQEPLFSSSGPLLLNLPRDSSAALKLRPLMLNLCCEASLFLVSRHSPLEDTQFKPPKKTSCNGAGPFRLLISKRGGSRHKPN